MCFAYGTKQRHPYLPTDLNFSLAALWEAEIRRDFEFRIEPDAVPP